MGTYVCVSCLFSKTTDGRYLRKRDPEAGQLLQQRHHVLSALDGCETGDPNVERAHLIHLTEANLQEFVVMRLASRRPDEVVHREWTLPRRGGRVDVALPRLRVALELKRHFRPAHPTAGRVKHRRDAAYVAECAEQVERYRNALGETWDVLLVSPNGSVPGSLSVTNAIDEIERRIRR